MRLPLLLATFALSWSLAEAASAQVNRIDYSPYHRATPGKTAPGKTAAGKKALPGSGAAMTGGVKAPANAGLPANFYQQGQGAAKRGVKGGVAKIAGRDASNYTKTKRPRGDNNYKPKPLFDRGGYSRGLY